MPTDGSYLVKRNDPLSAAILAENKDEIAQFFDQPLSSLIEAMTGALAIGPTAWLPATGRIVQAILSGTLLQQVSREIKALIDKGKIPADFGKDEHGYRSWVLLMRTIDEEAPEAEKLDAMKALFYGVNRIDATDSERIVRFQLLGISKRLNSGALLVLKAARETQKENVHVGAEGYVYPQPWAEEIAKRIGHGLYSLVLRDQKVLMEEGLISPLETFTRAGQANEANARLTELGLRFCAELESCQVGMELD